MAARHRIPVVFNIYMLDVICCALGCVILLWQVAHQEAEQQTASAASERSKYENASAAVLDLQRTLSLDREKARQLASDLERARHDYEAATQLAAERLKSQEKTLAELKAREKALDSTRNERDNLKDVGERAALELARARAALERASSELGKTQANLVRAKDDVAAKEKVNAALQMRMAAAADRIRALEKDVAEQQLLARAAAERLRDAEASGKKLEQKLATASSDATETQTKLALADLRLKVLEKELEKARKDLGAAATSNEMLNKQLAANAKDLGQARTSLADLEKEKNKLATRARALEVEAEQRFAGIELKGESVIFLVDMSGSMELSDANTIEPDKWPLVCETIAKLMRSLPSMKRFQVILFSDRARYLFGHEGQWLKFDGEKTVKIALDTLRKVQPKGETNLHQPLAEAFRFRPLGLDTLYVLSDGLPNSGDGLPATADKLSPAQKSELLGRDLRTKLKTDWNRRLPNQERVHINTIGVFFESPDVGAFLWALARENEGAFVGLSKP